VLHGRSCVPVRDRFGFEDERLGVEEAAVAGGEFEDLLHELLGDVDRAS
jgi:hypothetical protein